MMQNFVARKKTHIMKHRHGCSMKSCGIILVFAICSLALSSCSIVRGLTTDGKYGPNIFSFEKREVDTIANGEYTFQFPIGKHADWIDTMHFHNTPHQCD